MALRNKARRASFEFVREKHVLDKKAKVTTLCWSARADCKNAAVSNVSNLDQLSNIKDVSPEVLLISGCHLIPVSDGTSLGRIRGLRVPTSHWSRCAALKRSGA